MLAREAAEAGGTPVRRGLSAAARYRARKREQRKLAMSTAASPTIQKSVVKRRALRHRYADPANDRLLGRLSFLTLRDPIGG
jgi:hypothetical protein